SIRVLFSSRFHKKKWHKTGAYPAQLLPAVISGKHPGSCGGPQSAPTYFSVVDRASGLANGSAGLLLPPACLVSNRDGFDDFGQDISQGQPAPAGRASSLANGSAAYSRRQLLANAAIAASRVGS